MGKSKDVSYMLPEKAFEWIFAHLPKRAKIVELGSGKGTERLSERFKMISIEDNPDWIGKYNSTYIHAPIKDGWYDRDYLEGKIPQDYNLLIIDGPSGSIGRLGILNNLDLFNIKNQMLVDDIHRPDEAKLLEQLEKITGRKANTMRQKAGSLGIRRFGIL